MSLRSSGRLISLAGLATALAVVAAVAAVAPATQATASPSARCAWRPDFLPLPAGLISASVTATDGDSRLAGTGFTGEPDAGPGFPQPSRAVVWQSRQPRLLPTPDGYFSAAEGVNRRGDVVGLLIAAGGIAPQPVLWRDGQVIELATLGNGGVARDINDAGLIAGDVVDLGSTPVTWHVNAPGVLHRVPSPSDQGILSSVTEEGVLVGTIDSQDGGFSHTQAAAGTLETGLRALPNTSPRAGSTADAAAGDYIVGGDFPQDEPGPRALIWHGEQPRLLSSAEAYAYGVNSRGIAVGSDASGPVVWVGGVERRLRRPPGTQLGQAWVITEHDDIAGHVGAATGWDLPVLWRC